MILAHLFFKEPRPETTCSVFESIYFFIFFFDFATSRVLCINKAIKHYFVSHANSAIGAGDAVAPPIAKMFLTKLVRLQNCKFGWILAKFR